MAADRNQTPVTPCDRLQLDDFQRAVMPMAVVALLAFACAWMGFLGSAAYNQYKLIQAGTLRDAEVYETAKPFVTSSGETFHSFGARYRDARGKQVDIEIPKGIERRAGVQFSVLQLDDTYVLPERAQDSLGIMTIMALAGLMMFFMAPRALKLTQLEKARITRLTTRNQRVPASALRVSEHRVRKAKSYRQVFRVHATFQHANGDHYEAISQDFNYDPSEALVLAKVQVLIDLDAPRQSLIAEDTLPKRTLTLLDRIRV